MKTFIKIAALSAMLLVVVVACNKTKMRSNHLIEGGAWKVTELSVDGTNEAELPEWEIEACEIYSELCHAKWENLEGGHSEFIWQFREKAKTFEISRQGEDHAEEEEEEEEGHEHDHAAEEAAAQAYAFSGVYEVIERKKDMMQFQTTAALGHSGKTVVIKIEKK